MDSGFQGDSVFRGVELHCAAFPRICGATVERDRRIASLVRKVEVGIGSVMPHARARPRVLVPKLRAFRVGHQPLCDHRSANNLHLPAFSGVCGQPAIDGAARRHRRVLADRAKRLASGDANANRVLNPVGANRRASGAALRCWFVFRNHRRSPSISLGFRGVTGGAPRCRPRSACASPVAFFSPPERCLSCPTMLLRANPPCPFRHLPATPVS